MGEFKWNEVRAQKAAYPNEVTVLYRSGFHSVSSTEGFNAQHAPAKLPTAPFDVSFKAMYLKIKHTTNPS